MSVLKGEVGSHKIAFETVPAGNSGQVVVQVSGKKYRVRWNLDQTGIWLESETGVTGYDLQQEISDDGKKSFVVIQRGFAREWSGLHFMRAGEKETSTSDSDKKKSARVKSQMPGKIVRILVSLDAVVEKDQPLIVMEAMKMENEIKAPQAGRVSKINITEGQALETGTELLVIEALHNV